MHIPINLSLETKDVGATIAVTLKVNGEHCISWMAGTRHHDYAAEMALEKVNTILRDILLGHPQIDSNDVKEAEYRLNGDGFDWEGL